MKRVTPADRGVMMPKFEMTSGVTRTLWNKTSFITTVNRTLDSACLGCPDQICAKFADTDLGRRARVESPHSPDSSVCPTDALMCGDGGIMNVSEDDCIGCGLCVVRCPVGAIHLDPDSAIARVEKPHPENYTSSETSLDSFYSLRASLSIKAPSEKAPFQDASRVHTQLRRAEHFLEKSAGQDFLRLLTRNAFLLSGSAARLKNVGDNNAVAELLVDAGSGLLVVEVESGSDLLDAVRRALTGSAVSVARLGASLSEISTAIVMPKLPNERVEYYRVTQDIYDRLGLAMRGIPVALLLLAIRAGGGNLGSSLELFCQVNGLINLEGVRQMFGNFGDPLSLGLVASK